MIKRLKETIKDRMPTQLRAAIGGITGEKA